MHLIEREQRLARPIAEVFDFFADAFNLEALTPPVLRFEVVSAPPIAMARGTLITYRLRLHGVRLRWLTEIDDWSPPHRFVDRQRRGPYKLWHHTHEFESLAGDATLMRDTIRYQPAFWPLGELAMPLVRRDLETIFDFRRDTVARLLG